MLSIDSINTFSSALTMIGWLIGLAYYNWFASAPHHLPLWAHVALVLAGSYAASVVIGGGMALLAGSATQAVTGRYRGSAYAFRWAAFISPVMAFFAAGYILRLAIAA